LTSTYRELTGIKDAEAPLHAENSDEPYLGGIRYQPNDGGRIREVNVLSGGQKNISALALLFAIQR